MTVFKLQDIINFYVKSIESFISEHIIDYEIIGYDQDFRLKSFIKSKLENFNSEHEILTDHVLIVLIANWFRYMKYNYTMKQLDVMIYDALYFTFYAN